jgi:hypothetical protein
VKAPALLKPALSRAAPLSQAAKLEHWAPTGRSEPCRTIAPLPSFADLRAPMVRGRGRLGALTVHCDDVFVVVLAAWPRSCSAIVPVERLAAACRKRGPHHQDKPGTPSDKSARITLYMRSTEHHKNFWLSAPANTTLYSCPDVAAKMRRLGFFPRFAIGRPMPTGVSPAPMPDATRVIGTPRTCTGSLRDPRTQRRVPAPFVGESDVLTYPGDEEHVVASPGKRQR